MCTVRAVVPRTMRMQPTARIAATSCERFKPFALFFPAIGVIAGIVAIVYGAQVNGKVAGNNYAGAHESSSAAKLWTWITFAFVVLEVLILAALLFILILAAAA